MLTEQDLKAIESRLVLEKRFLKRRGRDLDVADIMGVIRDYNLEATDERDSERS